MRDGACLVGRLILGQYQGQDKGERVFWDKFWGVEHMDAPSSANSMSHRDTMTDKEVLPTFSRFQ